MKYSVVVATYNSALHIESFFYELLEIFEKKKTEFEIILVNDSSTDGTQQILDELSHKHPQLRVFELTRNSGQQIAFSAGIDNASGNLVILLDDDMLSFEEAINAVIFPVLTGDYDIAIGTSLPKGHVRKITSRFFWKIMSRISNQVVKNRELTLRCFSREVASNYKL